jgi:hypothetical protein
MPALSAPVSPPDPRHAPAAGDGARAGWPWSEAETALLRAQWPAGVPTAAIAAALGRSTMAVRQRALLLGLRRPSGRAIAGRPWTADDLAQLRQRWLAGEPAADIAAALDRTSKAIRMKARKLALPRRQSGGGGRPRWTAPERDHLRRQWQAGIPVAEIAAALGRTSKAIREAARRLGLPRRSAGRRRALPAPPKPSPNGAAATDGLTALRREVERLWLLVAAAYGSIDPRQAARALGLASPDDVDRAIERVAAVGRMLAEQRGQSQER